MRNFLLLTLGMCSPGILLAAMFSWTDTAGNIVFGDTPPEGVTAKEISPPKLTVLEGFASRYDDGVETKPKSQPKTSREVEQRVEVSVYESLKVIAPKQDQAIRANDGDVSVALSFSPKLRTGHQITFTLDGKVVKKGTSKVANMTNLDRGSHVLLVSIVDQQSNQLISSELTKFVVLRNTALRKKPLNPYSTE